jgi:hypothetical protein
MNFLTPLFLLGALAIAGPIIYHLVRRTTRETTTFSSLMFLQPSPPRVSKRNRIENLPLLLLRCAALGLLALGFARPFMRQAPVDDPTAAQPKRIVVLVDQSASMQRLGVWASAQERVESVLRRAGPADQVALYGFDRLATPLVAFEDWNRTVPGDRVAFAMARLAGVTPGWSGTHLGNALVTAAEALAETDGRSTPGPRQVFLVSDLQEGSRMDSLQAYEWPRGVELFIEPAKATSPTNAGLQLVADGVDSTRAVDAPVRVRVTNASESKREQFQVGWTRGGGTTAAFVGAPIDAYVPPGQSRVFAVPFPEGAQGVDQLMLRGDDEPFDNRVYFIPPLQQRTTVMWIGSDVAEDPRQPLFFLRRAFTDTPRVGIQVLAQAPGAPLLANDVNAAGAIFVSENIPAATATALRERALAGKTIVFAPRSAAAAPALATLLNQPMVPMEEARPATYAMFAEIDFNHPLFAPFADPRYSDFTKIHIWKYRRLDATTLPNARVVSRFDTGDPAVVEFPVGRGRVIMLAAGWHPEDSQLAVSSKFVPLMWSLLELGGGIANVPTQYGVGDSVVLRAGEALTQVRTPAGEFVALSDKAEFRATMQPGIYEAAGTAGMSSQRFAVNLDANESRTTPLGLDELEQLGVPLARVEAAATEPAESKTLLQGIEAESRQKLWRWFIAATLAVLLVESALAGWTARKNNFRTQEVAP